MPERCHATANRSASSSKMSGEKLDEIGSTEATARLRLSKDPHELLARSRASGSG